MGTVPLVEGVVDSVATFTTNDLSPGTITVKAVYSGEPEEFDESQVSLKHQVIGVLTEAKLLPVSHPSPYLGLPVTLDGAGHRTGALDGDAGRVRALLRRLEDPGHQAPGGGQASLRPRVAGRLPERQGPVPRRLGVRGEHLPTQSLRIDGGTVTSLARKPSRRAPDSP